MSRTRVALGIALSIGLALTSCQSQSGSSSSTTTTAASTTTSSTTTTVPTETWYVCDGAPAQCLNLASGWTLAGQIVMDAKFLIHSVIRLPDGKIRIYGTYSGGVMSYISDDGVHFYLEPGIRLNRSSGPYVIQLGNGSFRMYFEWNNGTQLVFMSAISSNGLDFVEEPGERLVPTGLGNEEIGITGPRVVMLKDGSYRMYYTGETSIPNVHQVLLSAVSKDGLQWNREDGMRIDGGKFCSDWKSLWLGYPLIDKAGTFRIFCGLLKCDSDGRNDHFGIFEFTSPDGLSFTLNSTPVAEGYYIKSRFKDKATDPRLFPAWGNGVITPSGLRLYFSLNELPWTDTPGPEHGNYLLLNPSIK